jgi:hypothetical protein
MGFVEILEGDSKDIIKNFTKVTKDQKLMKWQELKEEKLLIV